MDSNNENSKNEGIEAQWAKRALIYREEVAPGLRVEMDLKHIFTSRQSKFQQVDVIETYYGKTLVTDGKTQSAQRDEFAYHESLVHPALLRSASMGCPPKSIFIGGGGELATAREVLRHKSVERCVMVDIDGEVVELCKHFLPEWGGETVTNDSRFELVVGDAYEWLTKTEEKFDVIIMDISDPIEAGPGIMLYTKEFYEHAITRLHMPGGVFVTQAGTAESIPAPYQLHGSADSACYGPINNTLHAVFDCVLPYSTNIPSFGGDWGFIMAFQTPPGEGENALLIEKEWRFPPSTDVIDDLIEKQIEGGAAKLGLYDGITHLSMFALTKALRQLLEKESRIMTRDNPVFMY